MTISLGVSRWKSTARSISETVTAGAILGLHGVVLLEERELAERFGEEYEACQGTPRHLSTDHDPLFEAHRWQATLRVLEIGEMKTVPHVPMSHPFVERLIGTLRREFLDHVLFWNARDLERKLADFTAYYNSARVHAGLDGHTPSGFARGHPGARAQLKKVRWISHCGGLVQLPMAA